MHNHACAPIAWSTWGTLSSVASNNKSIRNHAFKKMQCSQVQGPSTVLVWRQERLLMLREMQQQEQEQQPLALLGRACSC
jgi:hypothetical protein